MVSFKVGQERLMDLAIFISPSTKGSVPKILTIEKAKVETLTDSSGKINHRRRGEGVIWGGIVNGFSPPRVELIPFHGHRPSISVAKPDHERALPEAHQ